MLAYQMYKGHNELKGLSHKTIRGYEYDLFQWFRFLYSYQEDKTYKDVTSEDIEEYLMYCKSKGNEVSRLQRRVACISSFYIFLRKKKKVTINPALDIERPRKKTFVREKHFLKMEQVEEMKSRITELNNIVAETLVLLAINTAARRNALLNIKWSDIDFEEREIDVIEKGPKEVTLYISIDIRDRLLKLKEYYKENNIESKYVFLSYYHGEFKQAGNSAISNWVRNAGKLIGIDNLTPHSLRRTAATLLYHNGVDLLTVSNILNHNSTQTTQIYLQANKKKLKNIKDSVNL
ncbi:tyrosine-type recombinase/integrase [Romboutsia sp. 1001285H_161024_C4]|uniref:tyrosine-type recombinase/integrase n=1 Tax=Romboutsia sp. 1001285H_161024_C4 TaxID=2787109 RepID=UPI001898BA56|nr:tyrosine-type recombinase/integrase [Romboutsia sp. 1001285H_161024_C4]